MSILEEIKYNLTNFSDLEKVIETLDNFSKLPEFGMRAPVNAAKKEIFDLVNDRNQISIQEEFAKISIERLWERISKNWSASEFSRIFRKKESTGPNPIADEIPLAEIHTCTLGIDEEPPEEKDLLKWKASVPKLTKKKFFLVAYKYKTESRSERLVLMIYLDENNNPEYLSCDAKTFKEIYGLDFYQRLCYTSHEEAIEAFWLTFENPACWHTLEGFWENKLLLSDFGIRQGYSIYRISK